MTQQQRTTTTPGILSRIRSKAKPPGYLLLALVLAALLQTVHEHTGISVSSPFGGDQTVATSPAEAEAFYEAVSAAYELPICVDQARKVTRDSYQEEILAVVTAEREFATAGYPETPLGVQQYLDAKINQLKVDIDRGLRPIEERFASSGREEVLEQMIFAAVDAQRSFAKADAVKTAEEAKKAEETPAATDSSLMQAVVAKFAN